MNGCLSLSIWACAEAEYHGREHVVKQSCSPHCSQEAKRARKGLDSHYPFQRPKFLPLGPHLSIVSQAGDQVFSTWAFGVHFKFKR